MKLITANKLNRFWQKGIKPIKNLLGNTDISKIGDGTVTGAINELNTGMGMESNYGPTAIVPDTSVDSLITISNSWVQKINNIVSLSIFGTFKADGTKYVTICTLPPNLRPNGVVWVPSIQYAHDTSNYYSNLRINTDGKINVIGEKNSYFCFTITYIATN